MRVPGIPYVQGRNDYTDWDGLKYGIAIHNTSNDASDEGEASYATRRTDGVSSHLYADDDSVTQSLDTDDRAGHAGSAEGNDHSLAVEITGANGKSRQWWLDNVAWERLGWVLAWIIRNDPDYEGFEVRRASVEEMRRNPQVQAFYGHDDMRRAWGGTTHTDPGSNFPWDRLFRAVNKHLGEGEDDVDLYTVVQHTDKNVGWHLRNNQRDAEQAVEQLAEIRATVRVLAGEDQAEVIREELDRHRATLIGTLGETLAEGVLAGLREQLGDVADERLVAAAEAGSRLALADVRLTVDEIADPASA